MNNRKNIEKQLIEKAMKDEVFRQRLLENPERTIGEEFAIKIPESFKINVLQEESNSFYLILPPLQESKQTDELAEPELASVAGGGDGYSIAGCEETYALFCH